MEALGVVVVAPPSLNPVPPNVPVLAAVVVAAPVQQYVDKLSFLQFTVLMLKHSLFNKGIVIKQFK